MSTQAIPLDPIAMTTDMMVVEIWITKYFIHETHKQFYEN